MLIATRFCFLRAADGGALRLHPGEPAPEVGVADGEVERLTAQGVLAPATQPEPGDVVKPSRSRTKGDKGTNDQ